MSGSQAFHHRERNLKQDSMGKEGKVFCKPTNKMVRAASDYFNMYTTHEQSTSTETGWRNGIP